jgi:stage IV sporulation protein A
MENIYQDIAARTGGNIYIGVVGPVRTGKSTLIKRIMEELVIPGIDDPYRRERARDELPQSGSGRIIMTTEPKFIPEEAAEISPDGVNKLRLRMIDSVGYMVDGAVGAYDEGTPRMVTTPWFDREIPMTEAAELGTKKVMQEHCSIGLVVTTDGSVTDIERADYQDAEARAIRDMQATGKPFTVIVNSRHPQSPQAQAVREEIRKKFGLDAMVADCQAMTEAEIVALLEKLLMSFPMGQLQVRLPRWLDALEADHPIKTTIYSGLLQCAQQIRSLGQAQEALQILSALEPVQAVRLERLEPGTGNILCVITLLPKLFYQILSDKAGIPIENDGQLLKLLLELSAIRADYEKIAPALSAVRATGYGVVMPTPAEMALQPPQMLKKGSSYGLKLQATAPSIHMIRVDVDTQISPMVGDEQQSKELMAYLSDQAPEELWKSNIFGKSVYELIQDGLTTKLVRLPEEVRMKFRGTLQRIVNEGAQSIICLIL